MDEQIVGVIGLGNMGGTLARHLLEAGVVVVGADIDTSRLDAFAASGGTPLTSPAEVVARADCIIVCLPSASALDAVVSGSGGLIDGARPGVVIAETSTLPLTVKMAAQERIDASGMTLLDCTISGTGGQAQTKDTIYYASGPQQVVCPGFR